MAETLTNPPVTQAAATVAVAEGPRTVTYEFDTTASGKPSLQILYAVVIDGRVRAQEASRPGVIHQAPRKVLVAGLKKGAKVGLHLNTDACVGWRQAEVCQVTVGDLDVVVKVKEKTGQGASTTRAVDPVSGKEVYQVPLDGALWLRVSHEYTPDEARALLAQEKNEAVKAAVQRIYDGLASPEVAVTTEAPKRTLKVSLNASSNATNNIAGFDLPTHGAKRVHPLAYAAVFRAGLAAGVATMELFSGWRPLMGSIHHRAGIGLDVSMLGDLVLNRGKLVGDTSQTAQQADTVAEGEQDLLARYREARRAVGEAAKALAAANKALRDAEQRARKAPKGDADARAAVDAAKAPYEQAQQAHQQAALALAKVDGEWRATMAKKDGYGVAAAFRSALAADPAVVLIYDPWFMDNDTHDAQCATPNTMESGTDGHTHRNHFHVTVRDPRIPL